MVLILIVNSCFTTKKKFLIGLENVKYVLFREKRGQGRGNVVVHVERIVQHKQNIK